MTRAAVYTRISRDPEGLRAGVKRQRKDCRALCERREWDVVDVYEDNDLSAWSGKRRPEYERMLTDITARRVDAVVVWHLDRLTRHPKELEHFFDVCDQAGLKKMGTVSGDIDLSTRDGRLYARILGAVAKKSSDDSSARIIGSLADRATRGEWRGGGVRPFAYEWNKEEGRLMVVEDEAALLREAAERILSGETRREITVGWHEAEIMTSEGKPWSTTRLGQLLASPRIIGKRVYRGEVVADGNWEPILDAETQAAVVRRMRRQASGIRPGRQRWALTGLVYCGRCGSRLGGKRRRNRQGLSFRTYRCSNDSAATCGGCSVVAEPLEQLVLWTAFVAMFPGLGEQITEPFEEAIAEGAVEDPRVQTLRDALADVADQEKQLVHDHYVERIVSRDAFLESSANLRATQEALQRELGQVEGETAGMNWTVDRLQRLQGPPTTFNDAQTEVIEFWRQVAQTVFQRVTVLADWHGRRFSAERVVLVPRPEFPDAATPYFAWDLPSMSRETASASF